MWLVSRGQVQAMIVRHTVAISLCVVEQGFAVDKVLSTWKGNGISGIEDKCSAKCPVV
ncbi:hypothetical protein D3C86_923990 [compost metagenome]